MMVPLSMTLAWALWEIGEKEGGDGEPDVSRKWVLGVRLQDDAVRAVQESKSAQGNGNEAGGVLLLRGLDGLVAVE